MSAGPPVPLRFPGAAPGRSGDLRRRMVLSAAAAFALHLLYAIYHGVLGITNRSLWFLAMCALYGILAAMRFSAVLWGRKRRSPASMDTEYALMKLSGILLAVWSAVLLAVVVISLPQNIAVKHHEIVMITLAAYTFFKLAMAIASAVRRRKHASPLLAVLRGIRYAEVAASLLTLQRSMLVSFGSVRTETVDRMNLLTGSTVCVLGWTFGITMLLRGVKKGS